MRKAKHFLTSCLAGLLVLWASLGLSSPVRAGDRSPADSSKASLRALIQMVENANNAGDVEAWVALFADNAVYMPPGVPAVTTRSELQAIAEAGFRNQAEIRIEPLEITVHGDWALARCRVTGSITRHDNGEVVPINLKELMILATDSTGRWRITHLIGNSNTE